MNICQYTLIEFHKKFGRTINIKPTLVSEKDASLRANLIIEEAQEFLTATKERNIIEIADAIADLLYVVYGAAVTYGIDAQAVFTEVHRSNMTKIWEDGTIHHREEDGKIIKPSTYSPANIENVLKFLGWRDASTTEKV